MKQWKAWAIEWDGVTGIYCAKTAGRAKTLAARTITDAWNMTMGQSYIEMRCRRAPEYDDRALARGEGSLLAVKESHDEW